MMILDYDALIEFSGLIAKLVLFFVVTGWVSVRIVLPIIERWCGYGTRQDDSRTAYGAVATGVVRRRKRRPSISPWIK